MNKALRIIVLVLLVLIGVGYYLLKKIGEPALVPELPQPPTPPVFEVPSTPTAPTTPTATPTEVETSEVTTEVKTSEVIIKITDNGFEPKEIEITKGTKVIWINESNRPSWPASDIHPTHRLYPGSGIEKCGTPEQDKIFDACKGLAQGESWSFTFNEIGEWGYHDHLNPIWTGKIIVK